MRTLVIAILMLALAAPHAGGATPQKGQNRSKTTATATKEKAPLFASQDQLLKWIDHYRDEPVPDRLPLAVHAMRDLGLIRDPDQSGVYIGFVAGVLADNQMTALALVEKMFPMPPEDQGLVIRAVADRKSVV